MHAARTLCKTLVRVSVHHSACIIQSFTTPHYGLLLTHKCSAVMWPFRLLVKLARSVGRHVVGTDRQGQLICAGPSTSVTGVLHVFWGC